MIIESKNNKLIKEVKSLEKRKNRESLALFIVEGINIVEELIDREYPYKYILYSNKISKLQGGDRLLSKLKTRENIYEIDDKLMDELSDTLSPQGIIGVCGIENRSILEIKSREDTYIFLDKLQDPGNMGTIIRSADAFGISGIILNEGTVDPYNQKVVRSTMGAIFRVPLYYTSNSKKDLNYLKNKGFKLLSTSLEASNSIEEINWRNTIITIGNESSGVSDEIYELSDEKIKIEMRGSTESLNAGVAASIIMYESSKK